MSCRWSKFMAQEFGRVPSEAGSDLTDGVDGKSAGLSERLHGGTLVMSGCLGKYKGQVKNWRSEVSYVWLIVSQLMLYGKYNWQTCECLSIRKTKIQTIVFECITTKISCKFTSYSPYYGIEFSYKPTMQVERSVKLVFFFHIFNFFYYESGFMLKTFIE